MKPHVRWRVGRDMPELLDIEAQALDPWDELALNQAQFVKNALCLVVEWEARVVGHLVYQVESHSLVVKRLLVHPNYRRRGCARALLAKLVEKLPAHRRVRVLTAVPEENLDMHLFLKALDFIAFGVRRRHGQADAYLFEYLEPSVVDGDVALHGDEYADLGGEG
jgi:ribosomal protein S18 acetylase RimI-like enzyme